MSAILYMLLGAAFVVVLAVIACCCIAGQADRQMEQMRKPRRIALGHVTWLERRR